MNQATQDFIQQHQDEDVRQLAFLSNKYPEVNMPFALDQIRGRQMARAKLPRWAAIDGIVYPPHISMEQCSSEATALYKAELAPRLLQDNGTVWSQDNGKVWPQDNETALLQGNGTAFADLTGGFGVDFSYIAARLGVKALYVERQAHLCEVAKENFMRLGLRDVTVKNEDGVQVLHDLEEHLSLIFIDPARRDNAGNKVVSLQDCTPDVTLLQDEMLEKADFVIIKLSPMLDWHRAVSELRQVREVHIVSTGNECKELLLVLSAKENAASVNPSASANPSAPVATNQLHLYCVNDSQLFDCEEDSMQQAVVSIAQASSLQGEGMSYLYEPNASLMKAGCFGVLSERFGLRMLAKNSHLFVSDTRIEDFPGRSFCIQAISSFNKKELKRQLAGVAKANIATRNFPLSVAELRKRLKLKEGGDSYIFATTLSDESHVLLICKKILC